MKTNFVMPLQFVPRALPQRLCLLLALLLGPPCPAALLDLQALAATLAATTTATTITATTTAAAAAAAAAATTPTSSLSASPPALAALERRSGQGDTRAQLELGYHFMRPALEALAPQDLVAAQRSAAALQRAGNGDEALRQGRHWLQRAANAGRHEAELLLGYCYLVGLAVPRKPETGWDWIRKAADQGYDQAQYVLGSAYLSGEGLRENIFAGLFYIDLAAHQGHVQALRLHDTALQGMAQQVRAAAPPQRSLEDHVRAAEAGNVDVQYALAGYYDRGTLAPHNQALTLQWYQRAAEQGHLDAMRELARRYASGGASADQQALARHWSARVAALEAAQAP